MATFALGIKDMVRASATEANRYPHKRGRAYAASWRGGVEINTFMQGDEPWCEVAFMTWGGEGSRKVIYRGPMSGDITSTSGNVELITMRGLGAGED